MSVSTTNLAPQVAYDQTVEATFHGQHYLVHAFVREDTLILEVELLSTGDRWVGEFSAIALEEMTFKTGNVKKFPTFVKMLATALSGTSDAVFADLLTYADIEVLKQRKIAATGTQSQNPTQQQAQQQSQAALLNATKRYFFLTYIVEFDKVHYPLPLKFETNPDPLRLKQVISKLRSDNLHLRNLVNAAAGEMDNTGALIAPNGAGAHASSNQVQVTGGDAQSGGPSAQALTNAQAEVRRLRAFVTKLAEENKSVRELLHSVSAASAATAAAASHAAREDVANAGTDGRSARELALLAEAAELRRRLAEAGVTVAAVHALRSSYGAGGGIMLGGDLASSDSENGANAGSSSKSDQSDIYVHADGSRTTKSEAIELLERKVWSLQDELRLERQAASRESAQYQHDQRLLVSQLELRARGERTAQTAVKEMSTEIARLREIVDRLAGPGAASVLSAAGLNPQQNNPTHEYYTANQNGSVINTMARNTGNMGETFGSSRSRPSSRLGHAARSQSRSRPSSASGARPNTSTPSTPPPQRDSSYVPSYARPKSGLGNRPSSPSVSRMGTTSASPYRRPSSPAPSVSDTSKQQNAGSSRPRFDPSAFVRDREMQRQRERERVEMRAKSRERGETAPTSLNAGASRSRSRSRTRLYEQTESGLSKTGGARTPVGDSRPTTPSRRRELPRTVPSTFRDTHEMQYGSNDDGMPPAFSSTAGRRDVNSGSEGLADRLQSLKQFLRKDSAPLPE